MKRKKFLTALLSAAMMLTAIAPGTAFADELPMNSYTAASQGSVICQASVDANFSVKLPVAVTLNNDQAFSMPVQVSGDLVKGDTVTVTPAASVTMEYMTADTDHKKQSIVGTVSAGKTEFPFEELFNGNVVKDASTTVMVSGLTAGTWQGQLTYDISLKHTDASTDTAEDMSKKEPGLYNGKDFSTWEALVDEGKIVMTENKLTSIDKNLSGKLVLSDSVSEFADNVFEGCENITYISVPSGVTELTTSVFSSCSNLKEIYIPNTVTRIDDQAFQGCAMEKIVIPDSVTAVGGGIFMNCENLKTVVCPDSLELGAATFVGCTSLETFIFPKGTTRLSRTFDGCTNLKSVTIPNTVTSIEAGAFNNCTSLKSVTIPNSVTELGNMAFAGTTITSITIPNSVKMIGPMVFKGCQNLTSVVLSNEATYIDETAFSDCPNLTTIYYSGSLTSDTNWGATNATIEVNNTAA